jgi:hypothetical protein
VGEVHRGQRAVLQAERVAGAIFGTVFASVCALLLVYPAGKPGLAASWERTIQSQLGRTSPFSIWGQVSWLQPVQTLLLVGSVAGAVTLALVPRQRSLAQICVLSAAVIIATELTLEHWFYLYIPWFFGMLIAASAVDTTEGTRREVRVEAVPLTAPPPRRIGLATSHR